jgi:hypothetical protein
VNPAALFAALGGIPRLDRALCRGEHELFGSDQPGDVAAAIELCSRCPALASCASWATGLPPGSLDGVVAGRQYVWRQQSMRRPQTAVAS